MIPPLRLLFCSLLAAASALRAAAPAAPPPPTEIASDQGDSSTLGDKTTSIFTGHVVVTGTISLTCDYLKALSVAATGPVAAGANAEQFTYLLATGHVHLIQGPLEATCDRAEMLPAATPASEETMTLTGSPVVTDHGNGTVYRGEPIVVRSRGRDYHVTARNPRIEAPPLKVPASQPAPPT